MRVGLRARLIAAFVLLTSMTTFLAGGLAIRHSYEVLRIQKQRDELAIARNMAAQLDGLLSRLRQTIGILAAQPGVIGGEPAKQREAMTIVADVSTLIDNIVITGLDGRVVRTDKTRTNPRRIFPDSPMESFVRPALASRSAALRVYKSVTGQVVVSASAPILKDGKILDVISAGILTTNDNFGYVESVRIGESGYAYVVDEHGRAIVHPRHERLFEDFSSNTAVQNVLKQREGVAEFSDADGVPFLAAYAPLHTAHWGVVVCQTASESYVRAEKLYYFLLLVFVGSLIGAVVIAVFLGWRMSDPIIALARGARAVSEGRLDTRVEVTSNDELGDLAAAFNVMTAGLKRMVASEKLIVVGQLAAGLAHEVQNPLNVISGFADYLREKTAEDDARRPALDDISRESKRCQRLVSQLLDLARPREAPRERSSLNELVSETTALVRPQAEAQGIEIDLDQAANLPAVEVNRDQIRQVLLNLCLNACQAMPQGGRLRIGTARRDGRAEVEVRDSGVGISADNLPRLFTPFFTTKAAGTGLGLVTSYAMVEGHGGAIEVQSIPGHGATFTVSLPIVGGASG